MVELFLRKALSIDDQIFPKTVVKFDQTGVTKRLIEAQSPKEDSPVPPLGWILEITPQKNKEDNFVGIIVIRNTTMTIDKSDYPLTTLTESIFRFSFPIDGSSHTKNLPDLGKVSLHLELIDSTGNRLGPNMAEEPNR